MAGDITCQGGYHAPRTLPNELMQHRGYVDVDRLQAETTLEEAAARCGRSLDMKGSGREVRIDCPFHCPGDHEGRKELAINTENPQKVFMCHAYQCQFRGNLMTLMHGFVTGEKPAGGRLKGEEFQRIKKILAGQSPASSPRIATVQESTPATEAITTPQRNVALIDAAEPKVKELHDIDTKFVTDIAAMNVAAAAYVRRHPCLTPEAMKKWRCGYLPHSGGGDKRGWSLRGSIIYPVLSEGGKVLAWVGRDVQYETKEREYLRLIPAERTEKEMPIKHRFPKGFHRGLELFGQQASRLQEPGYREFIARNGLIVVEGFNDVIQLDRLAIPALGIMSNRMTEAQGEKIVRWAKQIGGGKVQLMFDNDAPGQEGAKEALWFFAQQGIDVRLVWSKGKTGEQPLGDQPEFLSRETAQRFFWGVA